MVTAASRPFSSRSRALHVAAAAAALAVLVAAGILLLRDGADQAREAVEQYIRDVNVVHAGAAVELGAISRTYQELRLDPRALRAQQGELEEAEATIRTLHGEVEALVPPPEAQQVHQELAKLLELQAGLAAEMTQLARYVPLWAEQTQAVDAATKRLQADVRKARTSDAQRAAFARYAASVGGVRDALSRLEAPPVLEPSRLQDVARLGRIHTLAGRVRDALAAGRAEAATRLLQQLSQVSSTDAGNQAQRAAAAAYNRRIERLAAQGEAVERELALLARRLD
jgi:hypothetical protein